MTPPRIVAVVVAGGDSQRLGLLTDTRAKAAVPVAGDYRMVDFALSNCHHSQISDVLLLQREHPGSIAAVVQNGRPWDLDRSDWGLVRVECPPATEHDGTADALRQIVPYLREYSADVVVVVGAETIHRLDYHELATEHLASGARATVATSEVDGGPDSSGDEVQVLKNGTVSSYVHGSTQTEDRLSTLGVLAFDPDALIDTLTELGAELDSGAALGDLGESVLPILVQQRTVREFRTRGYWRAVASVNGYWEAHMDMLRPRPAFTFDEPNWPVLSAGQRNPAARVRASAEVSDSLLAGGCDVAGVVHGSVLSPGVVVEKGAVVRRSVLLPGVRVRTGAVVEGAVLDDDVTIGPECRVTGTKGRVSLIGRAITLRKGSVVEPGEQRPAD